MNKQRKLSELFEMIRDRIKLRYGLWTSFNTRGFSGICDTFDRMYGDGDIRTEDHRALRDYMETYDQTNKMMIESGNNALYWWKIGAKKPRLLWIDKQIKELKAREL